MVEIIAFDMDGGAGSQNTSGERGWPRPCVGQEGGHTSWGSVGTLEDIDGLPGQLPALQRLPLSANTMRTLSAPCQELFKGQRFLICGLSKQCLSTPASPDRAMPMAEEVLFQVLGQTEGQTVLKGLK